jgi:phospholipid N-methyltransferase
MVKSIDWGDVNTVAEYGPGTGVFTERIITQIKPETNFFGIEINPGFFDAMQERYADFSFYNDSVENIEAICQDHGVEHIDAVVSGLPWAAFPEEMQRSCMDAMMRVLRPGGQFVTFAYLQGLVLPAGRRFKKNLDEHFATVESSEIVWRNLPPAIVYRCRH